MTDNSLDEIFKKQLPGHESPVPEDMWERIIRKKDKDRKGFFFFFTLAGLFLLGFGTAAFLLFGTDRNGNRAYEKPTNIQKVNVSADTVQSAATKHKIQTDSSATHVATFGNTDTNMNAPGHNYAGSKKSYSQKRREGLLLPITKEASTSLSRESDSKNDSDKSLHENENTLDTATRSSGKAVPVLLSSPKQRSADSVKPIASKKSDSSQKNTRSNWSLSYYASPDYPVEHKQEYLKGRLSYTIGLKVNRRFGNHLSGKIGIQFSQLNYTLADSAVISGAYRLNRVDVPVLAGYSWGNETLGMTVNAGCIINLYSWGADSIGYIKSNTGVSLYLGFNFSKHINERIDIFSEPYYRYQVSPMANYPNYFPNYIDVVGISFGVRFHFKK